ncbi:hypothetical protein [Candidatus Carsonella ruddii]|uniref:Uncharacterized protein n=1 Tax=Candidatus Carsonella ruddii PC isolate NHV TaxID=1202540 RepID=J3TES1_CARRU|nr:hypothetical protein [Candidatus Carsonella ruddii]AFP84357.1 hypothetical protein A357_0158 [Candidatus Carsonella ruddii PC isolate NHV]
MEKFLIKKFIRKYKKKTCNYNIYSIIDKTKFSKKKKSKYKSKLIKYEN